MESLFTAEHEQLGRLGLPCWRAAKAARRVTGQDQRWILLNAAFIDWSKTLLSMDFRLDDQIM